MTTNRPRPRADQQRRLAHHADGRRQAAPGNPLRILALRPAFDLSMGHHAAGRAVQRSAVPQAGGSFHPANCIRRLRPGRRGGSAYSAACSPPLTAVLACVAPARTAARVLDVANPRSSCACISISRSVFRRKKFRCARRQQTDQASRAYRQSGFSEPRRFVQLLRSAQGNRYPRAKRLQHRCRPRVRRHAPSRCAGRCVAGARRGRAGA